MEDEGREIPAARPKEAEAMAENPSDEDGELAIDLYQDKDNLYVKSTIAGVRPEDLDIGITNDTVTIRGQRRQEQEVKGENYFYQECYWGAFSRSFNLPVEVDVEKAEADLKDGILTLVLPKAAKSRTRKIKVKSEL